jgi:Na+/H+-dicarboxylate symporter
MVKTETGPAAGSPKQSRPWYTVLYLQVLIAIGLGVLLGYFYPKTGTALKRLGDAFIALIKMMIAPVIFCTVVHGIASMTNLAKVGRVGLKALVYFEVVSTAALAIGLLVGEIFKPGQGFNIDPSTLDPHAVAGYVTRDFASILFVLIVLGAIARAMGFSILRLIGYIKDELLIVLGTSSRWEGELRRDELNAAMAHPVDLGEALEREAL